MTVELSVVAVRPKEDGNVGAIARLMSNFDVARLILVAPRAKLGPVARRRSMAGIKILEGAKVVKTFEEAIRGADLVVGTTDLSVGRTESHLRRSITPEEWGHAVGGIDAKVAIVFGPEDNGLNVTELARCDLLVWIPTCRASPSLNLSHAAAIVLSETYLGLEASATRRAEPVSIRTKEREVFLSLLAEAMGAYNYPKHKRGKVLLTYRKILGRALVSEHECTMMMGPLRRILHRAPGRARARRAAR